MLIIRINGGIGNQLFLYSFYIWCRERHKDVLIDRSIYEQNNIHSGWTLDKVLPEEDFESISYKNWKETFGRSSLTKRICMRLFDHYRGHYFERYFKDLNDVEQWLKKLSPDQITVLEGYWQYSSIAEPLAYEIRKKSFKNIQDILGEKNKFYVAKMRDTQSICIHVRMGDYFANAHNRELYGNICTKQYYYACIKIVEEKYKDIPHSYFVFSDDIEKAKRLLSDLPNKVLITENVGENAFLDLFLMTQCKDHILANSSFSWWGCMLSNNDGMTLMPKVWVNTKQYNYLAVDRAILIDKNGNIVRGRKDNE